MNRAALALFRDRAFQAIPSYERYTLAVKQEPDVHKEDAWIWASEENLFSK